MKNLASQASWKKSLSVFFIQWKFCGISYKVKKQWLCLMLAVIITVQFMPILSANAAGTAFHGTYEQVRGFVWEVDGNTITFNADGTFQASVNMYEGFYQISGNYTVNQRQALCTVVSNTGLNGKTFTLTDINGNLVFEVDKKFVTIDSGAVFKPKNAAVTPKEPWEDAYMELIKQWKTENSSYNFALYDVDENGIPELFLAAYGFYNVFTYRSGKCIDLGTVNNYPYMWGDKNSFITYGGMGSGMGGANLFKIENDQLSEGEIIFFYEVPYGEQNATYLINGRSLTEEQYKQEIQAYINPSNSIYPFFSHNIPYIMKETRMADYVTVCNNSQPQQVITVKLNGKAIGFDQPPVLDEGRTLVPLRAIFEALGATVNWDEATQTITATKGKTKIVMQIGNKNITINNKTVALDVAPKVVNNRTLVPVRAVAEGFQAGVDWDGDTQTVFLTSDFYDFNVNNIMKNKAYSIFANPTAEDGHKVWEYNYKDDLNMTEKEYKDYVWLTSTGAALVETGVDLSNFDFINMLGNNNQKEYFKDAITRLLVPTEDEMKTMLQKNLEGIAGIQEHSDNVISIGSDIIELYKESYKQKHGIDLTDPKLLKDVGGSKTDFGLSVTLSAANDTITELMLLKTIADTYSIVGENYEAFIKQLENSSTTSPDKALILSLSKEIIRDIKKSTRDQIISAMVTATADNAIKEGFKELIKGIAPDKIASLKASIFLVIFKFAATDFIEASNSWLAFAGMNSIQKLAAAEYEALLAQAKGDKMPLSAELQAKLKNAAMVYTMSSIKCRNLLLVTVEKSHPFNSKDIGPFKSRLEMRNTVAYEAFSAWKRARVVAF